MNCKAAPEKKARVKALCANGKTQSPSIKGTDFLILGFWVVLLVGSAIYIFHGVRDFYFAGDDFTYFWSVKQGNAFLINPQTLHYVPIGEIIAAFPGILVGPNPLHDNILLISFYLIAAALE